MATLNKVILIGNLTRDPELRVTPKGTTHCGTGLAINRRYHDEAGAEREEVTFVDLDAWGKTAELMGKYLAKGSSCMIEGRLRLDTWEDKESKQKRSKLKVLVDNVQFLGAPKTGAQGRAEAEGADGSNEELEGELSAAAGGRHPF